LSEEVDQMDSLGDKKEVEAVSVMVARVKKFSPLYIPGVQGEEGIGCA